jgi:subtilisin family serine protease
MAASSSQAGRVLPSLQRKLEGLGQNEKVMVIVHLNEQADLSRISSSDKAVRLSYLKRFASEKQVPVMAFVRSLGDRVSDTLSFYIFNGMACNATKDAVYAIAALSVVDYVSDNQMAGSGPVSGGSGPPGSTLEWNIDRVNAPLDWAAGYTGQGSLVCIFDYGVRYDHETFNNPQPKWRNEYGWQNGWFDAVDPTTEWPVDPTSGHGTHVAGIAIGGDGLGGPYRDCGVAYGAKYIACRSDDWASNRHLCFQWIASLVNVPPYGNIAPDVVNCSWGDPFYQTNTEFWDDVNILRGLGISPLFCIGNNLDAPNWPPGNFPLTIGVGATNSGNAKANFSCSGPSPEEYPWSEPSYWGRPDAWWLGAPHPGLIKPDLMAPGTRNEGSEGIWSADKNDPSGYVWKEGTSMAAPLVTGALALMLQASRSTWNYRLNYYDLYDLLLETANRDVSGPPNNNYGWGRLDCYTAVNGVLNYHLRSSSPTATSPNNGDRVAYGGGKWHLVYESGGSLGKYIRYTTSTDNGTTWSQEANGTSGERIGKIGEGGSPALFVNPNNGDAYVVWVDGPNLLYSKKLASSSTWSDPVVLYSLESVQETPSLVVHTSTNTAHVAFVNSGPFGKSIVYGWFNTQTPVLNTTNLDGGDVSHPSVGVSTSGIAHVAWRRKDPKVKPAIYYACAPSWSVVKISESGVTCEHPDLVVSPYNSNVGVVWEQGEGTSTDIRWRRKVGASWRPHQWVCQTSEESRHPVIAANVYNNHFYAAWADSSQSYDWEVLASAFYGSSWDSPHNMSGNTSQGSKYPQMGYLSSTGIEGTMLVAYGEGGSSTPPNNNSRYVPVYEIRTASSGLPFGGGGGQSAGLVDLPVYRTGLLGCYPNPVAEDATIAYEIAQPAPASLKLYNVAGQVVRTLVEGTVEPGRYEATWNGKDASGRKVSSGIYFYRLVAGPYSKTDKLVVVR